MCWFLTFLITTICSFGIYLYVFFILNSVNYQMSVPLISDFMDVVIFVFTEIKKWAEMNASPPRQPRRHLAAMLIRRNIFTCKKNPMKIFPVIFWNRLKSTGLNPVISNTKKSYIASYYKQFFTNIKIKVIKINNKTGFIVFIILISVGNCL